jgi:hypothetical protein
LARLRRGSDHVGRAQADHLAGEVAHTRHVDALQEADVFALEILEPLFGRRIERELVADAARRVVALLDGGKRPSSARRPRSERL